MSYTKATLKASTKEAIENDIKSITWKGEKVYPDYPDGYEISFGPKERFIVTEPRQELIEPAEYDSEGKEIKAPVMGDWISHLVLPLGFDTSSLNTLS